MCFLKSLLTFRLPCAVGSYFAREQLLSSEKQLKMFQEKRMNPNYVGAWLLVTAVMAPSKNDERLHAA